MDSQQRQQSNGFFLLAECGTPVRVDREKLVEQSAYFHPRLPAFRTQAAQAERFPTAYRLADLQAIVDLVERGDTVFRIGRLPVLRQIADSLQLTADLQKVLRSAKPSPTRPASPASPAPLADPASAQPPTAGVRSIEAQQQVRSLSPLPSLPPLEVRPTKNQRLTKALDKIYQGLLPRDGAAAPLPTKPQTLFHDPNEISASIAKTLARQKNYAFEPKQLIAVQEALARQLAMVGLADGKLKLPVGDRR